MSTSGHILSGEVIMNHQCSGDLDLSGAQWVTILGGHVTGKVFAHGVKHLTMIGVVVDGGVHLKASEGKGVYHVSLTAVHVGFQNVGAETGFLIETPDITDYRRSNHITLQGCTARWCRTGYKFWRCTGVSLHGCLAEAGEIGVDVDGCESLSIHGGHFETNSVSDIRIGSGSFRTKEFGAFLGSPVKYSGPNVQAGGNDLSIWRDLLKVRSVDASGPVWAKSFNVQKSQ